MGRDYEESEGGVEVGVFLPYGGYELERAGGVG